MPALLLLLLTVWFLAPELTMLLHGPHPACLPGWSEGQSAGSICDAASGTPATGIICMLLVGIAGYLYDRSARPDA